MKLEALERIKFSTDIELFNSTLDSLRNVTEAETEPPGYVAEFIKYIEKLPPDRSRLYKLYKCRYSAGREMD